MRAKENQLAVFKALTKTSTYAAVNVRVTKNNPLSVEHLN
jgi:hypothetical protein